MEKEKGPVDLFPTEPTDEARQGEETLSHGLKGLLGMINEKSRGKSLGSFCLLMRKMGLEPTRKYYAQDP